MPRILAPVADKWLARRRFGPMDCASMKITSGRAQLAAASHGTGDPTVLLLHAGVTDRRSWHHVVDALPVQRCVSYDARGFGETTYQAQDGWSAVDDAVAVLDGYDVGSAVVVACSMGGRTALDLALREPGRVRALVLIGPAVSGAPEPTYEPEVLALDPVWVAAEERDDGEALNRLEARLWLDGPTAPEGRVTGPARDLFLEMNATAQAATDPGERAEDATAWDRVGEIAVPTLVMVGEHDLAYVKQGCGHLAESIDGARLVELPDVAHLPHLEGDRTTLAEIAAFVVGISDRGC
ncbi:MAG TPA: alpha/beta hydrolase [Nocardioides sp.]|uniref:alpha/beta fold hydrolase n=1 Tax=Nocardioides sp. TaxID=35761 RepID=UPI002E37060E|nr:alpha/beta hydrolase [Nocardioides sp.]HEX3932090.1 alpha/beta hydrolase [Nocardioides sp.]